MEDSDVTKRVPIEELAERMYQSAIKHIKDSHLLSQSMKSSSDSDALLSILGFEILLKCALLLINKQYSKGHDYEKLWAEIPEPVQCEILKNARSRMPGHTDLSDIKKLLAAYNNIFLNARYSYEKYESLTRQQMQERESDWLNSGAKINDADWVYYPSELFCLIYGLQSYIEQKLSI